MDATPGHDPVHRRATTGLCSETSPPVARSPTPAGSPRRDGGTSSTSFGDDVVRRLVMSLSARRQDVKEGDDARFGDERT